MEMNFDPVSIQLSHAILFRFCVVQEIINCSSIVCPATAVNLTSCPSDSHFIEDHTPLLRTSLASSKNLSTVCCEPRGHCVCSSCSKTICGENSIIQIYRTGNPDLPGQCCDQFNCIKSRWARRGSSDDQCWFIVSLSFPSLTIPSRFEAMPSR